MQRFSKLVNKPNPHRFTGGPRRRGLALAGGFTLVEMMFTCAIGAIIGLVTMGGMIEGSQLFRANSTEMIARDQGSRAIRQISVDMQGASSIEIYPTYLSTTGSTASYGSCAVLPTLSGTVAYYLYPAASVSSPGGLYYSSNAVSGVHPATDTLLVSNVQDFEFRSDVSGSTRVGFKIGIYGFPNMSLGSQESDIVRFSTSNLPRN
jgi:type II secretory pathway pseudopilin PulG